VPYQIFDGVYNSFDEAGGSTQFFNSKVYLEKANERLLAAIAELAPVNDYVFAPFVAGLLMERGTLSVLDFGGGPGISYLTLKHSLVSFEGLTYHSLDDEEICAIGRRHFSDDEASRIFRDQVSNLDAHYDFVHFGSVLQYVDDLGNLLSMIKEKSPKYIAISDAMIGSERTFVTVQDYYGHKHPFRFYNRADMLAAFAAVGYELVVEIPHIPKIKGQTRFYDMSNLPTDCRTDRTYHLVFKVRG